MENQSEPAASADDLEDVWPLLTLLSMACDCLLYTTPKSRLMRELEQITGLSQTAVKAVGEVSDVEALTALWQHHLPDYHYTVLLGRLALESPLRRVLSGLVCGSKDFTEQEFDDWRQDAIAFVHKTLETNERWLVGLNDARPGDPLPTDPDLVTQLGLLARRRSRIEKIFAEALPMLRAFVARALPIVEKLPNKNKEPEKPLLKPLSAAALAPPARRGPFLRRSFTEAELSAVRLLFTYVPDLAHLLPAYPLALAMQSLSGFEPPERLVDARRRLQDLKPNQPLHLTLEEALVFVQALHAGALLLLPDTVERVGRQLRKRLAEGETLDEDCRADCSRLLFLLTDADTNQRFRAAFRPLLKTFMTAVERTYPHAPEPTQARAEVAELVALR